MTRGRVGSDAAWSLAYLIATRLGTFGVSVAVARMFGTIGAGAFGIALQVSTLGALIAGLNLSGAVARDLAASAEPAERRAILGTSLRFVLVGGILVALVLVLGSGFLAEHAYRDPSLAVVLAASGTLALATTLFVWAEGALQGLRWFRQQALWGTVVALIELVVGIVSAMAGIVVMLVARTLLRLAVVTALVFRLGSGRPEERLVRLDAPVRGAGATGEAGAADAAVAGVTGRLLEFAIPSFITSVVVVATLTLLRVLLVHRGGLGEAGYYQTADSLAQGLSLVPLAAASAFMPAVARGHASGEGDLGASLGRALRRVTGFGVPLCLLAIGWGGLAIRLVYGAAFDAAGAVLTWLAFAAALGSLTTMFGAVLMGRGEMRSVLGLNLVWAAVSLAAFLSGFLGHGAAGVAAAISLGYVVMLVGLLALASARWGVSWRWTAAPVFASAVVTFLLAAYSLRSGDSLVPGWLSLPLAVVFFATWGLPELRSGSLRVFGRTSA